MEGWVRQLPLSMLLKPHAELAGVGINPMPGSGTSNTLPTAILAVILSLVSLSVAVVNVFLSLRNRRLDEADKQEQRQAEISYRYAASAAWGLFCPTPHEASDLCKAHVLPRSCLVHCGEDCVQAPLSEGLLISSQCCAPAQVHPAGAGCSLPITNAAEHRPALGCCMAHPKVLLMVRRYSKEVQGVLIAIERFKRRHCQESDELYYRRLRMMEHEEDWELRWLLHSS